MMKYPLEICVVIGLMTLLVIFLVGVFCFAFWDCNLKEISAEEYQEINRLLQSQPQLRWKIEEANADDNKISILEYRGILRKSTQIRQEEERQNLREQAELDVR